MGQFSYACKTCGGHEQFDWVTPCVVELALTTGKTIHVEGDVREQYDPEGERNEQGSQLPGLMLDAMLRGVM